MLSWTHIASPTLVNEARVGFSRLVTARTQANANTDEFKNVGIGGYDPTTTLNGGIPQMGLGRYSQVGANDWLPTKEYNNEWDMIDNVSVTKGNHSFKFGGEVRELHFPFFQVPYPHGEMNFARTETAYPSNGNDAGGTERDLQRRHRRRTGFLPARRNRQRADFDHQLHLLDEESHRFLWPGYVEGQAEIDLDSGSTV